MKIKHILTFFIATYLIVSGQMWSMSSNTDQPNTITQPEVIEGNVFLIPNALCYVGYYYNTHPNLQKWLVENALDIELKLQDVFVEVRATSNASNNWAYIDHPSFPRYKQQFPGYLPLYLLDGKNEEDIIEFKVHGKPVRLRCKQIGYRYSINSEGKTRNFGELLNELKQSFENRPNFVCGDKQPLIDNEILAVEEGTGKIIHGPRDYKWLIERRSSERRQCVIEWLKSRHPRLGQQSPAAVLPQELHQFIANGITNRPKEAKRKKCVVTWLKAAGQESSVAVLPPHLGRRIFEEATRNSEDDTWKRPQDNT